MAVALANFALHLIALYVVGVVVWAIIKVVVGEWSSVVRSKHDN